MRAIISFFAVAAMVGCSPVLFPDEIQGSYIAILPHVTVYLERGSAEVASFSFLRSSSRNYMTLSGMSYVRN
jgi:hypothetical protein